MNKNFRGPKKMNCMILANELSKMIHNYLRIESEKKGIVACYRPIIMTLSFNDGITQLELSQRTHMSAPTISLTLQKMEAEGLIMRKEDMLDKRKVNIFITDEGKALDIRMRSIVDELEEKVFSEISLDEQKQAEEVLKKLIGSMEKIGGTKLHEKNT